jgi:DNA (cytosine-5)-methyltransferase 1
MLTSRGLGDVLGDLAERGNNARWCVLGADDAGGPHQRKRIWILGYLADSSYFGLETPRTEQLTARSTRESSQHKGLADTRRQHGGKRNATGLATSEEVGADCTIHDQPSGQGRIEWWDIDPAEICDSTEQGLQKRSEIQMGGPEQIEKSQRPVSDRDEWPVESRLGRVANGVANRVDRLKAIGNGQVPSVAAIAFLILSEGINSPQPAKTLL